jgi:hypothetical protein
MRKTIDEQVDEYAETQVLLEASNQAAARDADTLSLYAEYEREVSYARVPRPARERG